jgi:plastocyanin domain-containing protein
MDWTEISVVISGVALIALILWYFFGEREAVAASENAGLQEVKITVKGGYSPDVIVVKENLPVRLDFYRDETASCSEEVIMVTALSDEASNPQVDDFLDSLNIDK